MRTLVLSLLGGFILSSPSHGAFILTIDPPGGTITGSPGQTIGWGFTLTEDTNYAVINSVTFSTPTTLGTFEGLAQLPFRITGPLPFSSGTVWSEAFDNSVPTGLARFIIDPAAVPGSSVWGFITVGIDFYSVSPDDPAFDPDIHQLPSVLVERLATVNIGSSGASVPEPSAAVLTAAGLAALLLRKRLNWRSRLGAVIAMAGLAAASASAQPSTCTIQLASTPSLRDTSAAEGVGDILVSCTGGTESGYVRFNLATLPAINITSKLVDPANNISEAMAVIDEPSPSPVPVVCQTPANPAACPGARVFPGIQTGSNTLTFAFPFVLPGRSPPGRSGSQTSA